MRVLCSHCGVGQIDLPDGAVISPSAKFTCRRCCAIELGRRTEAGIRKADDPQPTPGPQHANSHAEVAAAVLDDEEPHDSLSEIEDMERAALAEDGEDHVGLAATVVLARSQA